MLQKLHKFAPLWYEYSHELLQWQSHLSKTSTSHTHTAMDAERIVRMGEAKGTHCYILLGADSDYSLKLLQELQKIQSPAHILTLETQADAAMAYQVQFRLAKQIHVLYDSSPWALFMLTSILGLEAEKCSIISCQAPQERSEALQTWRKLFLGSQAEKLEACDQKTRLSLHLIAQPNEPHLSDFFAHLPPWLHEVLVIWDAENYEHPYPCAAPLKQFSHTLQRDFSAQRNRLLKESTGDFVLYLDADERLDAQTWEVLKNLDLAHYTGGIIFPRMTFEGDSEHVRMGHGLWPDVQLRLFPYAKGSKVHFINTVHEKLEGLSSAPVLAPTLTIWHYSHIYKSKEELQKRLNIFNESGAFTHTLSEHYPSLSKDFFLRWQKLLEHNTLWRLPLT